jgi:hypothetical protein
VSIRSSSLTGGEGQAPRFATEPNDELPADPASKPRISAASVLSTPVGFAEGVLGVNLYDWHREVLSWTEDMTAQTVNRATTRTN